MDYLMAREGIISRVKCFSNGTLLKKEVRSKKWEKIIFSRSQLTQHGRKAEGQCRVKTNDNKIKCKAFESIGVLG
jgi:hypothetical protein